MHSESIVKRFLDTVVIPSVSGDERQIIDYIKAQLDRWGFSYKEDGAAPQTGGNAGNLICKIKGTVKAEPILLAAHVDTVTYSTQNPMVQNGRIISTDDHILGADDRAGVTVLLEILEEISKSKIDYPDMDVVFIVSEEIGLRGSQFLDYSLIDASMGFNLDASARVGQVITAAPSKNMFEIYFYGKKAHAAVAPEKGISALTMASDAVMELESIFSKAPVIFNIGTIEGGGHSNVIPDEVKVSGEIRGFKNSDVAEYLDKLQEVATRVSRRRKGHAQFVVRHLYHAFSLPASSSAVRICERAITASAVPFEAISYRAGSDANIFNQNGIAAVNLGLGYVNNHSSDEYILVDDLLKGVQIGINLVQEAASLNGR